MLKRLVIAVIGAVGVLVVGLAVASATLWRADDVLVATVASDQAYVVTAPGVIDVGGAPATVTARTSAGHPVVVVVGRDTDVLGWIGEDPYELVTGLSGWHTLATRAVTATASAAASDLASGSASDPATASDAAAPATATPSASSATTDPVAVADPAGSDMWTASDEGTGSASVTWPSQSGRWSVLAASPDGTATTLSIAWPRTVTTPYLWPGVVAGGLLVLLALGLVARLWWTSRRAVAGWTAVEPAPVEVAPATAPRTRRELREAERLAAGSRSEVPRTGSVERVAPTTSPRPAGTFAGPGGSEPPAAARPGPFVGTRSETAGGTRQTDPTAGPAQLATDPQVPPSGESVPRGRRLLPRRRPAESVGHGPVVDRPTDALPVPGGPEAATSVPGAVGPRPAELRSPEPEPLFPRGARGLRRAASTSEPSVSGPDGPAGAPGRTADPSPAGAASAGTTSATGTPSATGASGHPMWTPTRPSGAPGAASRRTEPPRGTEPSTGSGAGRGYRPTTGVGALPPVDPAAQTSAPAPQRRARPSWLGADRGAPSPVTAAPEPDQVVPAPAQLPPSPVLPPTVRADAWRRTWGIAPADDAPAEPAPDDPEDGR